LSPSLKVIAGLQTGPWNFGKLHFGPVIPNFPSSSSGRLPCSSVPRPPPLFFFNPGRQCVSPAPSPPPGAALSLPRPYPLLPPPIPVPPRAYRRLPVPCAATRAAVVALGLVPFPYRIGAQTELAPAGNGRGTCSRRLNSFQGSK
jgi:hypothetical protein